VSRNELVHAAVMRLYHGIAPERRFEGEGYWSNFSGRVALRVNYADLRDFMFYQLGHAVIAGRRFRQCAVCGKWSLLLPGVNRKDRITCSGYCRLKLHRQRISARELQRAGWSPKKIAKELGSDPASVERWLSQATG
jgi:hypothetical protein